MTKACENQSSLPIIEPETQNLTAHSFLRRIYTDEALSLPVRMRAASIAIAYESPKLIATAIVDENDFATLLDRRIAKFDRMKLIEAQPTATDVIEQPTNGNGSEPTEVKPIERAPLSRIYSNRFRRRL